MPRRSVPGLLVLALLVCAGGARAADEKRTPNDAATKAGFKLVRSFALDFDGDGKSDTLGVCEGDRGLRICVFGEDEQGATFQEALPWAGGTKLKDVEVKDLNPKLPGEEVLLELYDETPDEKVKRIRVYSGYPKPREIFTSVIFRPKDENKRAEWEQDGVVQYGDARPGWYFWDEDGDGISEIFVRRQAQLLKVPKTPGGPARLLTGVREAVYAWSDDARGGGYKEREQNRFRDFLPAYEIAGVRGSAAFVPKQTLEDLQAEALAQAVYAATDGEKVKDVKVDFTPFFTHAADKDLATAWIENDAKGFGKDEWIEIELAEASDIHMVRVVGGCVDDKRGYRQHNVPQRFELRFDTGERSLVDVTDPKRPDRPSVAVLQIPVKDRPWAKQTLVFFDGKIRSKKVRLTLDAVKRQGRTNRTCVSEVSVH